MSWRYAAALLAGLAIQLSVKLAHLAGLVLFHTLPAAPQDQSLLPGLAVILVAGLASGVAVGFIARRQLAALGALNAVTPVGFYILYYLVFLLFGLAVAGGDSGFVGALVTLAWQKYWLLYLLHFAVTLLASMAGARLGGAFTPPRAA